ncbi:hypothetical protein [Stenotrophomonas sp.]|uniref:hypothetical protein n=1 Tax=Stenotrophomonas sp. TaxID=69392 RepID=UPI0028B1883D|nr:hypothetical protein [Stenotrophomonas sp.]
MIDSDELADVTKTIAWYKSNFFEGCEEGFIADFMVFCWQAVDPGRVASLDLDDEAVDACANMLSELKLFVDEKHGKWGVSAFWRRYIDWADYAMDFPLDECRRFMRENVGYLEPSFFIFTATGGAEMRSEAMAIFAEYSQSGKARATYVRSVIGSRLATESFYRRSL